MNLQTFFFNEEQVVTFVVLTCLGPFTVDDGFNKLENVFFSILFLIFAKSLENKDLIVFFETAIL